MWHTYLILCKDKSIYTGVTNNLNRRLAYHKAGRGGRYTRSRKAIKLLYSEQFKTKAEALRRERQIKGWRRAKKLNLIRFWHLNPLPRK